MDHNTDLANGDSVPFWQGVREGRLLFQQCRQCQSIQFPPRHHCTNCWEADLDWIESSGKGRIESVTIVRRAPLPEYRDEVPYAVAAVRVSEGPRMIARLVGDSALTARIGDPVQAAFLPNSRGQTLAVFRRDPAGEVQPG